MPKISIIIPVYNTEKYLKRCLESVCNQTLKDIEIICINDASSDNSIDILKEFEKKDNRIKVINLDKNEGVSVARNSGLETARGEYLGFVDSDDTVDLDFYEKLYSKAKSKNADIVKGIVKKINTNGKINVESLNDIIKKENNKMFFSYQWVSAIYKASVIHDNGICFPIQCHVSEDIVFLNRALLKSKSLVLVDDAYYNYFRREGSLNADKISLEHIKSGLTALDLIFKELNETIEITKNEYLYSYGLKINSIIYSSFKNGSYEFKKLCAECLIKNYNKCKDKKALNKIIARKNYNYLLNYVELNDIGGLTNEIIKYKFYNVSISKLRAKFKKTLKEKSLTNV